MGLGPNAEYLDVDLGFLGGVMSTSGQTTRFEHPSALTLRRPAPDTVVDTHLEGVGQTRILHRA